MLGVITVGEPMALFAARELEPLESVGSFDRLAVGAELDVATRLARLADYAPGVLVPRAIDTAGAGDGFTVGVISELPEEVSQ